jgi:hypothetical protein
MRVLHRAGKPITGSFFAAQFAGRLVDSRDLAECCLLCVLAIVFGMSLGVFGLVVRPATTRRAALAWHPPLRTACLVAGIAAAMARAIPG